jgi:hypothetical protein
MTRELSTMVELTPAELDAVAAGRSQGSLVNVNVEDVNVNVNALNGPTVNINK